MQQRNICIFVLMIILSGCTHTYIYKEYGYNRLSISSGRTAGVEIASGRDNSKKRVTVYGDPYSLRLLIGFTAEDLAISSVGLSLTGDDGVRHMITDYNRELNGNQGLAELKIGIGQIEYQNYLLEGLLVVKQVNGSVRYSLSENLVTNYRKEKGVPLFRALGGI